MFAKLPKEVKRRVVELLGQEIVSLKRMNSAWSFSYGPTEAFDSVRTTMVSVAVLHIFPGVLKALGMVVTAN